MSWRNYILRRRINVDQWLIRESITSKQDFLRKLSSLGVEPPDDAELLIMFPVKTKESVAEDESKPGPDTTERIDTSSARSVAPQGGEASLRPSGDDGSKLRARGNKSVR